MSPVTEITDDRALCLLLSAGKLSPTLVQMQSEGDPRAWIWSSYVCPRKLRCTNENDRSVAKI